MLKGRTREAVARTQPPPRRVPPRPVVQRPCAHVSEATTDLLARTNRVTAELTATIRGCPPAPNRPVPPVGKARPVARAWTGTRVYYTRATPGTGPSDRPSRTPRGFRRWALRAGPCRHRSQYPRLWASVPSISCPGQPSAIGTFRVVCRAARPDAGLTAIAHTVRRGTPVTSRPAEPTPHRWTALSAPRPRSTAGDAQPDRPSPLPAGAWKPGSAGRRLQWDARPAARC
jgi:hypothetical protein